MRPMIAPTTARRSEALKPNRLSSATKPTCRNAHQPTCSTLAVRESCSV